MNRTAKLTSVVSCASIFLLCQSPLSPGVAGANSKLVEAAKNEGAVDYYTTMTLSQSKKEDDKFQQKYPFIQAELFRGGGTGVLNRTQNDARGGLNAEAVL